MKRLFSLLLSTILLAPVMLSACSFVGNTSPETSIPPKETEPQTQKPLPTVQTYTPDAMADHILLTGRSNIKNQVLRLDWSLAKAEFEGEFAASAITASVSMGYGTVADLMVVVDNDYENAKKLTFNAKEPQTVTLAEVSEGFHNIKLVKANQALSGGIDIHSITLTADLAAKPKTGLKILILGDSISCGAGAVPTDRPEGQSDTAENSYGGMLMQQLDADVSVIAVSGWGLACGGMNYDALIPKLLPLTNYFRDTADKWDYASEEAPDAVIIALGTNDYRFQGEGKTRVFINAAKDFLETVYNQYPKAKFLWIYGQMLNQYNKDLEKMVSSYRYPGFAYMNVPTNTKGGFNHPDKAGHEEYAKLVGEWIKENVKQK